MSMETDATRLSEIGVRCEKVTEGPWLLREMDQNQICSAVVGPDGIDIIRFSDGDDAGAKRRAAGAFVAHAREDVPWLLELTGKLRGQLAGIRYVMEQQTEFLRTGCDIQLSEARARTKVFISMGRRALASNAGKPEADVLSAAARYEDADRQFIKLNRDNPWYNQCGFILLEDRAKAKKDLCAAVKRIRDRSGGAAEATEEGGGE